MFFSGGSDGAARLFVAGESPVVYHGVGDLVVGCWSVGFEPLVDGLSLLGFA